MSGYELLDFGQGRKLERWAGVLLDRPCPAAVSDPCLPYMSWRPHARYRDSKPHSLHQAGTVSHRRPAAMRPGAGTAGKPSAARTLAAGRWECLLPLPDDWYVCWGGVKLGLRLAASGQVGVFPEHAQYWPWIERQVRQAGPEIEILNLFGYTGGATLAAAAAGARVVHVDAARYAVQWARQNAQRTGLEGAPIRWIVDDCRAFVAREIRRRRVYHGLILDPPTYGHGRRGQAWRLSAHLEALLTQCARLLAPQPLLVLCTCHTPGYGPERLAAMVRQSLRLPAVQGEEIQLLAVDGRALHCGYAVRWPASRGRALVAEKHV